MRPDMPRYPRLGTMYDCAESEKTPADEHLPVAAHPVHPGRLRASLSHWTHITAQSPITWVERRWDHRATGWLTLHGAGTIEAPCHASGEVGEAARVWQLTCTD